MNIDFSLVLLVLSAVTGAIWLLDALVLMPARKQKLKTYLDASNISVDEFRDYYAGLDEQGRDTGKGESGAGKAARKDVVRSRALEQGFRIYREPVPVEYAKSFFPVLFAVLLLRSFLFEPFQIPTGSMIPTLNVGDYIVVNKYAYGIRLPVTGTKVIPVGQPKRGDVMVFIPPHQPDYFIKRVIGLPGDHVQYRDNVVYINGEPLVQEAPEMLTEDGKLHVHARENIGGISHDIYNLAESYGRQYPWMPPEGVTIPEGHYFMMGDHRDNSEDSRYWGPVSEDKIVGKAVAVWMHKEPGWNLPEFGQNRLINNPD